MNAITIQSQENYKISFARFAPAIYFFAA